MLETLIPPMATTRQIAYRATRREWDELLKWIETQTATFMESGKARNPWLMPEVSSDDHQKRLDYASQSYGIHF